MSPPINARPTICLNMIVKNEAHILQETLNALAPYIDAWVIVDTGSEDGTQDLIRNHMAQLDIPGELHERRWRNFGHNRSEALALAQGHADYIWVFDADDTIVGNLDFGQLRADTYQMRLGQGSDLYWRSVLFRDGVAFRYEGVVHEHVTIDEDFTHDRLEGDYHIESRRLGARNMDQKKKYESDAQLLLAEVERNPLDTRSVFYLAQSYYDLGDFENARNWYQRRAEMGDWEEEVYYSMYRIAESMSSLQAPWPEIQDAYLRAWEYRPSRAEPLYAIAYRYRLDENYPLGYLFARQAAEIPFPDDGLFVTSNVYNWLAIDEQALCASWTDKREEAFALWRRLLTRNHIPDDDRQRIARNLDLCAVPLIEAAAHYPDETAHCPLAGPRDAQVVVSLVVGPDPASTEHALNSFLNCCTDVSQVQRFLALDAGLSNEDRAGLLTSYPFLEFCDGDPETSSGARLTQIRGQIEGRFWLHLGQGWQFVAPDNYITRLTAVFDAEPDVFQVAINFTDAVGLAGASAADEKVRRSPDAGRYVLTNEIGYGPAMFDTVRLDRAGGVLDSDSDPIGELGRRATAVGLRAASLDELLCVTSA